MQTLREHVPGRKISRAPANEGGGNTPEDVLKVLSDPLSQYMGTIQKLLLGEGNLGDIIGTLMRQSGLKGSEKARVFCECVNKTVDRLHTPSDASNQYSPREGIKLTDGDIELLTMVFTKILIDNSVNPDIEKDESGEILDQVLRACHNISSSDKHRDFTKVLSGIGFSLQKIDTIKFLNTDNVNKFVSDFHDSDQGKLVGAIFQDELVKSNEGKTLRAQMSIEPSLAWFASNRSIDTGTMIKLIQYLGRKKYTGTSIQDILSFVKGRSSDFAQFGMSFPFSFEDQESFHTLMSQIQKHQETINTNNRLAKQERQKRQEKSALKVAERKIEELEGKLRKKGNEGNNDGGGSKESNFFLPFAAGVVVSSWF